MGDLEDWKCQKWALLYLGMPSQHISAMVFAISMMAFALIRKAMAIDEQGFFKSTSSNSLMHLMPF